MIDILCLAVIVICTYFVAFEGAWGAAHSFLCVLLAGLIAMNYFEPLANMLDTMLPLAYRNYSDIVALVGLFTALTFALRMASEQLSQVYIQLPSTMDLVGKWAFAALTGYVTMAFLLTALHTAPVGREFLGFSAERNNFMGMAPDRQWLGFVQHITEKPFGYIKYQDKVTKQLIPHAFDGKYEKVGEFGNTIWPSFPIRYATRRQKIDSSQPTANAPTTTVVQPSSPTTQSTPGTSTGGTPAGGNVGF